MNSLHRGFGIAIATIFILITIWGLFSWIRNRDPGKGFWALLGAGQVSLGLQAVIGLIVFALDDGPGPHLLHYVYGGFPVLVLIVAHRWSRRLKGLEWVAFAVAGFFIFGLQLRGLMTGTGG